MGELAWARRAVLTMKEARGKKALHYVVETIGGTPPIGARGEGGANGRCARVRLRAGRERQGKAQAQVLSAPC